MKKLILPIILFIMLTGTAYATSNLEISTTADFSSLSTNFSGGQTIFVRVASSSTGDIKSVLNIRDNDYKLANSFKLSKDGSYFSAVIPTPYAAGYYSLEAQIESNGSNTTSVKTIKVGNPTSANVNVRVNSTTGGQNVLGESSKDDSDDARAKVKPKSGQSADSSSPTTYTNDAVFDHKSLDGADKGVFGKMSDFLKEVVDFIWPF